MFEQCRSAPLYICNGVSSPKTDVPSLFKTCDISHAIHQQILHEIIRGSSGSSHFTLFTQAIRPHNLPQVFSSAHLRIALGLHRLDVSYRSIIWPPVASGNIPHFSDARDRDWDARRLLGISVINMSQIGCVKCECRITFWNNKALVEAYAVTWFSVITRGIDHLCFSLDTASSFRIIHSQIAD